MSRIKRLLPQLFEQERYLQIQHVLERVNLKYAVIKGEVLSKQIFGKTGQRHSADIDLLISRADIHTIEQLLIECGFHNNLKIRKDKIILLSSSHQVAPWVRKIPPLGTIVLDLNFDVFWGEYEGKRINMEEFLSDTTEMEIYGVKVKTLPPIKAMIQLILHHYKDMNSIFLLATRKSIKYDMFKDVYYLLKNNLDTISLNSLYTVSSKYEIIPYVFYVLYYTAQVFDDEILNHYVETFRTQEGEDLLNCYGLCAKERKEWKYDFKTRLETDNLYQLIKDDLLENDINKIEINKKLFGGHINGNGDI